MRDLSLAGRYRIMFLALGESCLVMHIAACSVVKVQVKEGKERQTWWEGWKESYLLSRECRHWKRERKGKKQFERPAHTYLEVSPAELSETVLLGKHAEVSRSFNRSVLRHADLETGPLLVSVRTGAWIQEFLCAGWDSIITVVLLTDVLMCVDLNTVLL